jgi:hypothetical protein
MVKPLADQMVDLSRKVSKFIFNFNREAVDFRFSSPLCLADDAMKG